MRFDVEKRIFFTKKLYELKSVTLVQRAYRPEYKNKKCPTKATILDLSGKLDRTGSLLDLPRMSERPVLRPELDWKFCSPKIRHYQSERHQLMSEKGLFLLNLKLGLAKSIYKWLIASHEAYFYLTESINKQNNRMWLEERPLDWIENPLLDEKVLVWCGISCRKILRIILFRKIGKSAQLLGNA